MTRRSLALWAGLVAALVGSLSVLVSDARQVPTIVIPPNWQGVVCAAYQQRAAACKDVIAVRAFLDGR